MGKYKLFCCCCSHLLELQNYKPRGALTAIPAGIIVWSVNLVDNKFGSADTFDWLLFIDASFGPFIFQVLISCEPSPKFFLYYNMKSSNVLFAFCCNAGTSDIKETPFHFSQVLLRRGFGITIIFMAGVKPFQHYSDYCYKFQAFC